MSHRSFYRLRLYPRADRSQDSSYLATAVRARCFAAADARDALRVDLDMSTGEPVAIEYVAASPACNADVATAAAAATAPALPPATPVTTKLPVKAAPMKEPGEGGVMLGGAGQAGSGAARQGQPGAGAAAGAGGKGGKGAKDERSWLQKNWLMVLGVGMMIINLVAKLNPPEGAAAGVPAAGGAAGRAAAARR